MANVELPSVVQQRLLNVLLNNESSEFPIIVFLFASESHINVIQTVSDSDSVASVGVFSGFDYPNVPYSVSVLTLLNLIEVLFESFEFVVFDSSRNVESDGKDGERVNVFEREVPPHVVKEGLFVANEEVALQVVMDFEFGRVFDDFNIFVIQ
jgi:hypothetical protein